MRLLVSLALAVMLLAACNTVSGIGRDIEKGGQAIKRAAD